MGIRSLRRQQFARLASGQRPLACHQRNIPTRKSFHSFVLQPKSAEIILHDGRDLAEKVDPGTGLFPSTLGTGQLQIDGQKRAWWIVAAAVVANERGEIDAVDLLDIGLRAVEVVFRPDIAGSLLSETDRAWPNDRGARSDGQYGFHHKAITFQAEAWSILLLQQAGLEAERVDALLPKVRMAGRWMAGSEDRYKFFRETTACNQLLSAAVGIHEAGIVTGDLSLCDAAAPLVLCILDRQLPDGTYPEKGGFDSGYQTLSLELLANYIITLPPSSWRRKCRDALRRGVKRFAVCVNDDGTIDTTVNTRTQPEGYPVMPGALCPKGRDVDTIPLRMHYMDYLFNDGGTYGLMADGILSVGQRFGHDD